MKENSGRTVERILGINKNIRAYEDDKTQALFYLSRNLFLSSLRGKTEKYLGNMILNFTNVAMKLNAFSFVLSAFAKFLLAMINLTLSFFHNIGSALWPRV